MLALNINDINIEKEFLEYAKRDKKNIEELLIDVIKSFLATNKHKDKLIYKKRDVKHYIHKINRDIDNKNLDNIEVYTHIEDSAAYIHDLRRDKK